MATWEFTGATKEVHDKANDRTVTVRQIRTAQNSTTYADDGSVFRVIPTGTLGGWIEKEENFPQGSGAWIDKDVVVYGDAVVRGSALVGGDVIIDSSEVSGCAKIYGNVRLQSCIVKGAAEIFGDVILYHCTVMENAKVAQYVKIVNYSYKQGSEIVIAGNARIHGKAYLVAKTGNLLVKDKAWLCGDIYIESVRNSYCAGLTIGGNVNINDNAFIVGNGFIGDRAVIGGESELRGNLAIGGHTMIMLHQIRDFDHVLAPYIPFDENREMGIVPTDDFLVVGPFRGEGENMFLTFTMDRGGNVRMYTRWLNEPVRFDIIDANNFDEQLYSCGYFKEGLIPSIVSAYQYAEKQLWSRQEQRKAIAAKSDHNPTAAKSDHGSTAARKLKHDDSIIPSIAFNASKGEYIDTFLIMGPFRNRGRNISLTFVVDYDGSMHMCMRRGLRPVRFNITSTSNFRARLYGCGYFDDDIVPSIISAYKCARKYLRQQLEAHKH